MTDRALVLLVAFIAFALALVAFAAFYSGADGMGLALVTGSFLLSWWGKKRLKT